MPDMYLNEILYTYTSTWKYFPPSRVIFLDRSLRSSPESPDNKNTLAGVNDDLDLNTDILTLTLLVG